MSGTGPALEILGARGGFGRELAAALSAGGFCVRGWSGAAGDRSYASFVHGWASRTERERGVAVVIAFGTSGGTPETLAAEHVGRTESLVAAWDASGWPFRVVLLGSASELLPGSAYGDCKRRQRLLLEASAPAGVLVTLRVHSVVPEEPPTRGLPADLHRQFRAGGPVVVHHLGGARDYVSMEQVALAVQGALSGPAGPLPEGPVDLGNGTPVRVADWIRAFEEAWGASPEIQVRVPDHPDPEIVADVRAVEALLASQAPDRVSVYRAAHPSLVGAARRWRRSGK